MSVCNWPRRMINIIVEKATAVIQQQLLIIVDFMTDCAANNGVLVGFEAGHY